MNQKLTTSSSFYVQLYQIVDERSSDLIISWSKTNSNSFIVWDMKKLRREILPKSVGLGTSLTEFIAKLRNHGFKRIQKGPGELEFIHDDFSRGLLRKKKMMVKALSERIQRFDTQIKAMKCRVKAKKATLKVESLFQNLRI